MRIPAHAQKYARAKLVVARSWKMEVYKCLLIFAVFGVSWADLPLSLDKDSFAEVIGTGNPVFVKFFAPW